MKYVKPELEVLKMMTVDVITASVGGNGGSTNGGVQDNGESNENGTPGVGFHNGF